MAGSTARLAAIETLFQLEKTRKPVTALFENIARQYRVEGNDRQLAMKIVYGVLRNRDYLERLLDILCSRPVKKIKPFVRHALLTGLYQIYFLDRIPPSAAINETVNVIKSRKLPSQLQGFVNGVLRQSVRQKDQLPSPHDPDEHNRPVLNHPNWLTERWRRRYGEAAMIGICLHNNREPALSLRLGSDSAKRTFCEYLRNNKIAWEAGAYAPHAVIIRDLNGPVAEITGIPDGRVRVQDQAAQLATMLLAPFTGRLAFLDGCAGLGGKTTHIIELVQGRKANITAVEPDRRRYQKLEQSLAYSPQHIDINLINKTLQEFCLEHSGRFDRILIDAPCSGTGVIGKHPDIRWNRTEQDLADYTARQFSLLSTAADMTAPGGILVYSTCSIEPEENDMVVDRFLEQHAEFSQSDCSSFLPASCKKFIRNGCFAPLPEFGIDGFFAARLVKHRKNDYT